MEAIRYLPNHTPPAQPFPVVLKVNSSFKKSISFIMKEMQPSSCIISKGEPLFVRQNGEQTAIKWLSSTDEEEELYFAYLATPDQSVQLDTTLDFSGQLMVEGTAEDIQEISGNNQVTIRNYHWVDSNRDYIIDDGEILAIYNIFDILQDLGIDIAEIRQIWAHKGYRYHAGKFEVVDGVPTNIDSTQVRITP